MGGVLGESMGRDGLALPLTRGQLDIWLSQESGYAGTDWQLGLLVKIEGAIHRDVLERAICRTVAEAEPAHSRRDRATPSAVLFPGCLPGDA